MRKQIIFSLRIHLVCIGLSLLIGSASTYGETIEVKTALKFPILLNGKNAGFSTVAIGSKVDVLARNGEMLQVKYRAFEPIWINSSDVIDNKNNDSKLEVGQQHDSNSFDPQKAIGAMVPENTDKLIEILNGKKYPDDALQEGTSNKSIMIAVKGGTLPAGSDLAGQAVEDFQIGKCEVTRGEWKEVREWALRNGYDRFPVWTYPHGSEDNFPANNVSWLDAVKWCNAKSEKEGLNPVYTLDGKIYKKYRDGYRLDEEPKRSPDANGYRLPSEKEWEWAARGGVSSQGYIYSGSNTESEVACRKETSEIVTSKVTKAVGTKIANELGIYDMSGSVTEMCEDVVVDKYLPQMAQRKMRGSCFWGPSVDLNDRIPANPLNRMRNQTSLNSTCHNFGFRLARNSGN